jgi:hypothetical protein
VPQAEFGTGPAPRLLRLVWIDPVRAADGLGPWARGEASRLLSVMGLASAWREAAAGDAVDDDELRVIVLGRVARSDAGVLVLGATPPGASGSRFVWVHADSVRTMLGGRPGWIADFAGRRRLGLALGRVVAHELVHALAPAVPHGGGLMAGRLGRRELEAARIDIGAEVSAELRHALERVAAGRPAPGSEAAPAAALAAVAPSEAERPAEGGPGAGWSAH